MRRARGAKIDILFGAGKRATFMAGGRKRHLVEKVWDSSRGPIGHVVVNGVLRFADGTEAYALLEIDESSSGEHCGTGVFLPDGGLVWQDEKDFCQAMGKTKAEVFPYKYRYTGTVKVTDDHHIGDDGWSL